MTGGPVQLASGTAMVLAAGMGTRMRPLTDDRPKPMVEVAGKPLIDHALDHLTAAGVANAIVNVHYRADQLEAHLTARGKASGPAIRISDERAQLLETGGGMVAAHAAGLLPDPFFCLNADNVWIDEGRSVFHELSADWDADRMDALLLLVPHDRAANFTGDGDFHASDSGQVRRRISGQRAPYIYSGIQLVSHRLLRDAPAGRFSTNILWDRALAEGRLFGTPMTGRWFEVGTPQSIAPTEAALADG